MRKRRGLIDPHRPPGAVDTGLPVLDPGDPHPAVPRGSGPPLNAPHNKTPTRRPPEPLRLVHSTSSPPFGQPESPPSAFFFPACTTGAAPPPAPLAPPRWCDTECTICYENAVDTVLYACGHMCLCYACGLRLKQMSNACCPILQARHQGHHQDLQEYLNIQSGRELSTQSRTPAPAPLRLIASSPSPLSEKPSTSPLCRGAPTPPTAQNSCRSTSASGPGGRSQGRRVAGSQEVTPYESGVEEEEEPPAECAPDRVTRTSTVSEQRSGRLVNTRVLFSSPAPPPPPPPPPPPRWTTTVCSSGAAVSLPRTAWKQSSPPASCCSAHRWEFWEFCG
ncbi:hypothetical protein CRUP_021400, partial [Coryphaenoides rupestris]